MRPGPWRRRFLRLVILLVLLGVVWWLGLKLAPPPDPYAVRPAGVRILDREGRLVRGFLSPDEKRRWRLGLAEISPELITAVLHHEDRGFRRHPGVDAGAVARAAWSNLRAGRVVSGASTITMQLARLTEPRPRTLGAKLHQMVRALQYESLYSKDQILEMYLNLAPYGGNVEGVGPAARVFFGKPAAELSWGEACQLAVLPQSPLAHDPVRRPAAARQARDALADRLLAAGIIAAETHREIHSSPLPTERRPAPFAAPHFSRWARNRHPGQDNLRTTLDLTRQEQARRILADHARRIRPLGVEQAAAVVLDALTGEIRCMVGSAGFRDTEHQGQVNGATAPRSPGSTLKPLVYALAFDRGLTTPDQFIEDVPRFFADYSPRNYSGRFSGAVRCGDALQRSLNVPAVTLAADLEKTQGGGLHRFLQDARIASVNRPAGHYGLTLVLGGGEVDLLHLASLYGLLARHGRWLPVRDLVEADADTSGRRLLGEGACWLTLREMQGVRRPEPERVWQNRADRLAVAWKTGTSFGYRDAWSVGVVGDYVVAVWVGNFGGAGSPHLKGAELAAPLLFALIEGLGLPGEGAWQRRPDGVLKRELCALSGLPPGRHCPGRTEGFFLPGVSPAGACGIHRAIQVDAASGLVVCSRCRGDAELEERVVEWWPPEVASYLAAGRLSGEVVPAHNPACPVFGQGQAPVIASPRDGREYILRRGVPRQDQALALKVDVGPETHQVWWFVDGVLVAKGDPAAPTFVVPPAGNPRITVVDEAGRSHTVRIRVRDETGDVKGRT